MDRLALCKQEHPNTGPRAAYRTNLRDQRNYWEVRKSKQEILGAIVKRNKNSLTDVFNLAENHHFSAISADPNGGIRHFR